MANPPLLATEFSIKIMGEAWPGQLYQRRFERRRFIEMINKLPRYEDWMLQTTDTLPIVLKEEARAVQILRRIWWQTKGTVMLVGRSIYRMIRRLCMRFCRNHPYNVFY